MKRILGLKLSQIQVHIIMACVLRSAFKNTSQIQVQLNSRNSNLQGTENFVRITWVSNYMSFNFFWPNLRGPKNLFELGEFSNYRSSNYMSSAVHIIMTCALRSAIARGRRSPLSTDAVNVLSAPYTDYPFLSQGMGWSGLSHLPNESP